jgi:hypothetical protein
MRSFVLIALAAATLLLGAGRDAEAQGAWCARYNRSTENCGFYTLNQCLAAISGVGGFCEPSRWAPPPRAEAPRRKHRRDDRRHHR